MTTPISQKIFAPSIFIADKNSQLYVITKLALSSIEENMNVTFEIVPKHLTLKTIKIQNVLKKAKEGDNPAFCRIITSTPLPKEEIAPSQEELLSRLKGVKKLELNLHLPEKTESTHQETEAELAPLELTLIREVHELSKILFPNACRDLPINFHIQYEKDLSVSRPIINQASSSSKQASEEPAKASKSTSEKTSKKRTLSSDLNPTATKKIKP